MLIAFEGIDGAGKSTVARLLHDILKGRNLPVELFKNSSAKFEEPFVQAQMERLRNIIWCPAEDEPERDVLGAPFYLFSLAAWYSVLQKYYIAELQQSDRIGIFDGWYYRTIAKAFIRERFDKNWLRSLFTSVSTPDLVVLLDIDPRISWSRRPDFKNTEIGRWDGFVGDRFTSYSTYQGLVRNELLLFAEMDGWMVIHQEEGMDARDVVDMVVQRVSALLPSAS